MTLIRILGTKSRGIQVVLTNFAVLVSTSLGGCSSPHPTVVVEGRTGVQAGQIEAPVCPDLAGVYLYMGEETETVERDGAVNESVAIATPAWITRYHPRGAAGRQRVERSPPAQLVLDSFELVQLSTESFEIRHQLSATELEVTTFHARLGDFICRDGRVQLARSSGKGYSDGVGYTHDVAVDISRDGAGALVYRQEIRSTGRSFLVRTSKSVARARFVFLTAGK